MLLLGISKKEVKHEENRKLEEFGLRNDCQIESKRERDTLRHIHKDLTHKNRISFNNESAQHLIEI